MFTLKPYMVSILLHSSMSLNLNFDFHLPSNHFTKLTINQEVFSKGCNEVGLERIFVIPVLQNELENKYSYNYKLPPNLFYTTCSSQTSFQVFLFLMFQGTFQILYLFTFSFVFYSFFFAYIHKAAQGLTQIPETLGSSSKPTESYIIWIPIILPKHINIFLQLKGKHKTFT